MTGRPRSYRDLLAIRDLPVLLAAALLSRLAERMLALALVLYALARFASPAVAGWLSFAMVAPGLLISPLSGALLDRAGCARAITIDMIASATLVAALIAADRFGGAMPATLFILVAGFSLTSPLSAAGIRTLLPRLAPPEALDRVNAVDTALYAIADVCGPALAGSLTGFVGSGPALIAIGITYAAAAACVARVRGVPEQLVSDPYLTRQVLHGLRLFIRQPTLRGLATSYGLHQLAWGILTIAVPVSLIRYLSADTVASITGAVWAAVGVAGGVSALAAGHFRTAGRERSVMAFGMAVTAIACWPLAAAFGLTGVIVGVFLAGIATGPVDVGLLTLRQRRTDPAQFGRVLSISISLNIAGFPLGSALAGMLVARSLSMTFAVACIAAALAVCAIKTIPADEPART